MGQMQNKRWYANRDLLMLNIIAVLAIFCSGVNLTFPLWSAIYALPMALIVPGYSLTAALFLPHSLNSAQRFTFTLGGSLSICVLTGLVLNLTPSGIKALNWALMLGLLTLLCSFVALYRRHKHSVTILVAGVLSKQKGLELTPRQLGLFSLTGVLLVSALIIATLGAGQQQTNFTQFWLLPQIGFNGSVQIGLNNYEQVSVRYRVVLKIEDYQVQEWPELTVKAGERWETNFELDPKLKAANFEQLDAILYRLDEPTKIYRQVSLTRNSLLNNKLNLSNLKS